MAIEDIDSTDVGAALEAGKQALDIQHRIDDINDNRDANDIPVALVRQGETLAPMERVLQLQDERAPAPRRRKGTAKFTEVASFVEHVNRFKDADSVIFADIDAPSLTAILDYHKATAAGAPRWGQHRSLYLLPLSDEWKVWTQHDQQKMTQEVFAQFLEDHMDDLRGPVGNGEDKGLPYPADMLTMARNLVINTKGEYQRKFNPSNGDSTLICKYENELSSTKIPEAFMLGLPVFKAGPIWPVKARLRLDMSAGKPMFSYALLQPDQVKRNAFDEVRQVAKERTELPVLAGTPE
jgi:uncharacterized protein YfdQ (DUF2303 family)